MSRGENLANQNSVNDFFLNCYCRMNISIGSNLLDPYFRTALVNILVCDKDEEEMQSLSFL